MAHGRSERAYEIQECPLAIRSRSLKPALDLLSKAQIAHVVQHTSANGLPLGSEVNPKFFKVIFLDVALAQSLLGINLGKWVLNPKGAISNRGAIAEAFVGQEMLAYSDPGAKGELYYWTREKRASLAEVNYVEDVDGKIVPIEVKSGRTGSLKSLRLFLESKQNTKSGVRFSLGQPRKDDTVPTLPLYAVGSLRTVFH